MEGQKLLKDEVLYKDKFCKLTGREIKIFKYYFPLASTKVLHMDKIEKVYLKEDLGFFEKKMWGMPCAKVWYGIDWSRMSKKCGVWIKPKGTDIKIGLTPDSEKDCNNLYRLLTANINKI